jgi:ribosomal protein S18 acetylase RimI-like enzyme
MLMTLVLPEISRRRQTSGVAEATIRPAVPGDAEPVERLRVAGWQAAYRGLLPDGYLDGMQVDAARRRARMTGPAAPRVEHVAVTGSTIVGWVAGGPCRDADRTAPQHGEVYACYVQPGWWGRGAGRLLLDRAVRDLAGAGLDDITLWVLEGNHRARRFYEGRGFRPDGARQWLDIGGPVPEVRYQAIRPADLAGDGRLA